MPGQIKSMFYFYAYNAADFFDETEQFVRIQVLTLQMEFARLLSA